ncbi:hypothetical protein MOMA_06586 [Moraxella macacae 0408225]|uniref:Ribosomal RNA small subunit methyltransferase E n=1 Tax=Moraxella macacae 0408225 TaxID=1230338 RepID=L2F5A5_9GAMM|nr:16S rRNA (uracil(1498)-N(3))-methyltransferase [Moraxella macacae]ELA08207.1 hypothetical protein MOMA_06586 [Moraxella macacae 0408225]
MRRFFYTGPDVLAVGKQIELDNNILQHWCKVLRANIGDKAVLFDGQGGEYIVTLTKMSKKTAYVSVDDFLPLNRNLPFKVTIGLVMSRGDRMDYAIQKSCEMGVFALQLLTSHHSEVRLKPDQITKKLNHWQGVAKSACEQCGLNLIPTILPPLDIQDFIQNNNKTAKTKHASQKNTLKLVLAVPERLASSQVFDHTKFDKNSDYCLLIGAEGGLSDDELALAYQNDFLAWQIGERVLRTETAPVVALTALQTLYGLSIA